MRSSPAETPPPTSASAISRGPPSALASRSCLTRAAKHLGIAELRQAGFELRAQVVGGEPCEGSCVVERLMQCSLGRRTYRFPFGKSSCGRNERCIVIST